MNKILFPILGLTAISSIASPIVSLTSCAANQNSGSLEVTDTEVKKQDVYALNEGYTSQTITIEGFKVNDKTDLFGLKVKPINQTFGPTTLTMSVPDKLINWDKLTFDVEVMVEVPTKQTIEFDLEFTNTKGKTFTSKGYKFTMKPLVWKNNALGYCEVKGKNHYFAMETLCDDKAEYIVDTEGWRCPRDEFNYEIWLNPNFRTSVGTCETPPYFLMSCYKFNSPIHIPDTYRIIGSSFLANCTSFNQVLSLPVGIQKIWQNFLLNCSSFNQELHIPGSVDYVSSYFLADCSKFNSDIVFDCSSLYQIDFKSFLYSTEKMTSNIIFSKFNDDMIFNANTRHAFMTEQKKSKTCTEGLKIIVDNDKDKQMLNRLLTKYGKLVELDGWEYEGTTYYRNVTIEALN